MKSFLEGWLTNRDRPRVIILGNEKGGSGKSTIAIHLVAGLMSVGFRVGSIDLDGRQATLSHFIDNRRRRAASYKAEIPISNHRRVSLSRSSLEAASGDEKLDQVVTALEGLSNNDFIVVDTPGSDSVLCRAAHVLADTLVTPLNASYLDLDALVEVDEGADRIVGPSPYSELVLYMMEKRLEMGASPLQWIVVTNRLPNVDTRVNRAVSHVLDELVPRLGFRLAEGIHDRVVFRELFLQGLTVFDVARRGALALPGRAAVRGLKEMEKLIALVLENRELDAAQAPHRPIPRPQVQPPAPSPAPEQRAGPRDA